MKVHISSLSTLTYWVFTLVFGNDIGDARDLKTVEKDLAKSSEKKERAYSTINKLNNEQKKINEDISRITNQAAAAERNARDKEETFKRDQETTKVSIQGLILRHDCFLMPGHWKTHL